MRTLPDLLKKVNKTNTCWLWTDWVNSFGYAECRNKYRKARVHRLIYELLKGPIPEGYHIDHLCRVRHCVNPDHLEAVTQQVNIARGEAGIITGQKNKAKTHCPKGHEYTEKNTKRSINTTGTVSRGCRLCANELTRLWKVKTGYKSHTMI